MAGVVGGAEAAPPPVLWSGCEDGVGGGECTVPRGIATNAQNGHVFVAEEGNRRITELTAWGDFVGAWGWGVVASGPDDKPQNEIQKVTVKATGGTFRLRASFFQSPLDIKFDASAGEVEAALIALDDLAFPGIIKTEPGDLHVTGPDGGPWLIEFTGTNADTDVRPLEVDGSTLTGPGSEATLDTLQEGSNFETCIAANGDICRAGQLGTAAGQFNQPQGVALDSAGDVYVVDQVNRRVQKFDSDGDFVVMFGGQVNKTKVEGAAPEAEQNLCPVDPGDVCQAGVEGTGKGQFGFWGEGNFVAVDTQSTASTADDTVYVGDQGRIQLFDTDGQYIEDLPDPDALLAGRTVQSLSLDPEDGSLYAAFTNEKEVFQLNSAGENTCTLEVERPTAIAARAGTVWVVDGKGPTVSEPTRIAQFSGASCDENPTAAVSAEAEGIKGSTGLALSSCGGSAAAQDLYVTSLTPALVRAYGAPPIDCEPPPLRPPLIEAQYPVSVGTDAALVRAGINPRYWSGSVGATRYYVQYATAECLEGEAVWEEACVKTDQPPPGAVLKSGPVNEAINTSGVLLGDLLPSMTYHFRFVAVSDGGGPEYGLRPKGAEGEDGEATIEAGMDRAFTTPPLRPDAGDDCPNRAFRTSSSSFLPDCRAFEMVSPVDKNGGGIKALGSVFSGSAALWATLDQSSEIGDGITYSSRGAFGDAIGAPYSSQYISSRDEAAGGWLTHAVNAPHEGFAGGAENTSLDTEYKAFSGDLSEAWLIHHAEPPLAPCAPENSTALYRRLNVDDKYEALHCKPNIPFANTTITIQLLGLSADGCHAVFRSNSRLTADAVGPLPGLPPIGQPYQLYESSCEAPEQPEGPLRLIGILPNGKNCELDSTLGSAAYTDANEGRSKNVWHAFSEDAHRIYWTCGNTIYLRTDPDLSVDGDEVSVEVSGPTGPIFNKKPPRFEVASADGSRALFTTFGPDSTYRLQEYDATAPSPKLTTIADRIEDVSLEPKPLDLMGADEDATRAYFVSRAVLSTNSNSQGDKAIEGAQNLYLYDVQASLTFIATLTGDRLAVGFTTPTPVSEYPFNRASRVTPDGLHAAFISTAPLTDYDNTDADSGKADAEVFVYDASEGGTGKLMCVSCNPTGARPMGRHVVADFWAAASIPGWQTQLYQGHPLSSDGRRLFFNSFEALVNRDTNSRQDVYEWEQVDGLGSAGEEECETLGAELFVEEAGGCISLISSGQHSEDSQFVDADLDGSDVFIRTGESLLPQDPGLVDIYDARVGGGFPPPPGEDPPCEGEACQSPPAPPSFGTPATGATGLANPKAPEKHCPKGKRKVRKNGKTRCVKRSRNKGNGQQRASHNKGRASR